MDIYQTKEGVQNQLQEKSRKHLRAPRLNPAAQICPANQNHLHHPPCITPSPKKEGSNTAFKRAWSDLQVLQVRVSAHTCALLGFQFLHLLTPFLSSAVNTSVYMYINININIDKYITLESMLCPVKQSYLQR